MAKQIDKSMLIHEIIEVDPGNAAILMAAGMHCVGLSFRSYGKP